MHSALQEIREAVARFSALELALPPWNLPLDDMGRVAKAAREYADFAHALAQCRENAKEEFAYIHGRIEKVKSLGREVARTELPPFRATVVGVAQEEQEKSREIHAQVKAQFEAFKTDFADEFARLEEALTRTAREAADFKVVLFGRTQVGKSTIREALTCGNGETIGRGSSSTTKKCQPYIWRNLHVWDTPGIDSRKDTNIDEFGVGDEERDALEKLETADIAIFVCKTDSVEVKEREWLGRIVESGRPYMILMNVVSDITKYSLFKKRGMDRKITREAQRGFIDDLLAPFPEAETYLIPVHARACFFSRAKGADEVDAFYGKWGVSRSEVYGISNFGEFRSKLTAYICGKGCTARRQTIDRVFVERAGLFFHRQKVATQCLVDALCATDAELEKTLRALGRVRGNWTGSKLGQKIDDEMRRELKVADIAEQCIEEKWGKKEIANHWTKCLNEAKGNACQSLKSEFQKEMGRIIQNLQDALAYNTAAFSRISAVVDNSIDGRKAMKRVGWGFGAGGAALFAVANWWNPAGWVVGAAWVLTGVGIALGFLARLFQKKDAKINKLSAQFTEHLNDEKSKFCSDAEKIFNSVIERTKSDIRLIAENNKDLKTSLGNIIGVCCRAEGVVQEVKTRMEEHG